MRTFQTISLLILTALVVSSCSSNGSLVCRKPSGAQNLLSYDVQDFEQIDLQMAGDVVLKKGDEFKVVIEAADNIHDILIANVSGSELTLRTERGKCIKGKSEVVFYVTCPDISAITLSGSGSIKSSSAFEGQNLDVRLTGSGQINLESMLYTNVFTAISGSGKIVLNNLNSEKNEIKISGSGDLEIGNSVIEEIDVNITGSGQCEIVGGSEYVNASISGSGRLNAKDLSSNEVAIKIGGSGGAFVTAEEILDVVITGSGNVRYLGQPSINSRITGSGKIVNEN